MPGGSTIVTGADGTALLQNGTSLVSTHIYNNRLQPCWMYSTTGTALAVNHLCSDTATAANMLDLKYNFNLGTDNGNPISITNNRVSGRSQTFTYDQLNRISTAQTTGTHASDPTLCWGQAFGYDSTGNWSNLLSIAGASSAYTGCTQGSLSVTVNTKNQISTDTYDAAGNLMTIPGTGGATYVFNTENQMTSTSNSTMQYIYDGDGNRVEKSGSKIYWYSGSEVLDETDMTGNVSNSSFNEYLFFGGNRIARRDSSNNVFYYLADQLGSSRVIVQGGQTAFCYDADLEPFGGEHAYTNTCAQNYKFTGKERDSESNLDNFGARYYASTTGRFMSPDWALKPVSVPYASFGDPQTLNLYTYVQNSPLNRIDADGHQDKVNQDESGREPPNPGCEVPSGTSCALPPPDPNTAQNTAPVPTSLKVESATDMTRSNPARNYGIFIDVKYQVLDQNGKPMQSDKMQPMESGAFADGTKYSGPIVSKEADKNHTQSDGTFHDKPVGLTAPRPMKGPATQKQDITIVMGDKEYKVRSQTYTVTSQGYGKGRIVNDLGDIDVTRP